MTNEGGFPGVVKWSWQKKEKRVKKQDAFVGEIQPDFLKKQAGFLKKQAGFWKMQAVFFLLPSRRRKSRCVRGLKRLSTGEKAKEEKKKVLPLPRKNSIGSRSIKMTLKERFLHYISFDTQSDERSNTFPSTSKQLRLLEALKAEMEEMGMTEVSMDCHGYVMGTLPATPGFEHVVVLGFIAHVDTSPDMSAAGVNPRIIDTYKGGDIPLNADITMKVSEFPELERFIGHTLFTTDGTTLLGADDKAGVAEIMTMAEYFLRNPQLAHGKIRIAFTPDEEIGRGADYFDVEAFSADVAFTVDGGYEGELEWENFNAADAHVKIQGRNVHPGSAKGKMINALQLAHELHGALPPAMCPELTEGYEGFFHLHHFEGTVESAQMEYIIRDHDRDLFEEKKERLQRAVDTINRRYETPVVALDIQDRYYNMKEKIVPYPELIEIATKAMLLAGVKPLIVPIRGGTDGARLSFMGLPCPNIFAGGMNFHGRYEYCSLQSMQKAVKTLTYMAMLWGKAKNETLRP